MFVIIVTHRLTSQITPTRGVAFNYCVYLLIHFSSGSSIWRILILDSGDCLLCSAT